METGVFLFNNKLELTKVIPVEKLKENSQVLELNGIITSTVTADYEKEIEKALYFGQKEKNDFWLYKIRKIKKENGFIVLDGIHIFFDDLKGKIVRDLRPTGTAENAVTKIFENTGWQVGYSDVVGIDNISFYHKSVLNCFNQILEKWDCEFIPKIQFQNGKIISKKVELYNTISTDYGKWFEYGDKLLTVLAEETTDIFTAFIGTGKGEQTEKGGYGRKIKFDSVVWEKSKGKPVNKPFGQDYVEINSATALWGYPDGQPKIGIVDFSEIEDKEELLKKTYDFAIDNCRPKLQMKATAFTKEKVELGETVAIIRSDMNIRYKTRIFKIKKDFLNSNICDFEFGDKIVMSVSDRIKENIQKELKTEEKINSIMESFLETTTNYYFNEDGYNYELKVNNEYKLPAGYYSFDKPINENPAKVVYMGAGKILIADSKNPNGEWKWRTAITPQGIAGEEITTNSITANKLSADVGQSLDLSSNISINNTVNTAINKEVDKIQIGGRNIARNSQTFFKNSWKLWGAKEKVLDEIKNKENWNGLESINFKGVNFRINSEKVGFYDLVERDTHYLKFEKDKIYTISFDAINLSNVNFKFTLRGFENSNLVELKAGEQKRVVLTATKEDASFSQIEVLVNRIGQEPKFSCKFLKVENGNKSTSWTPALEDLENIDNELKRGVQFLTSENEDLLKKIKELNEENLNLKENFSTSLKQTEKEFKFQFEKYTELIDSNNQSIDSRFNNFSRYIRFSDGNVELGDENSPFKTLITHEKISFIKNGVEVAYMSNERLYIVDSKILKSIQIGNFEFAPRQNGNLSFRKAVN